MEIGEGVVICFFIIIIVLVGGRVGTKRRNCIFYLFYNDYFISKELNDIGGGSGEKNSGVFDGFGKVRVFGKESVSGVDDIGSFFFGKLYNVVNIKVLSYCGFFRV